MSKNRNGITLIALVVTIIVLLILAGVSIITLTGDNGIITRTEKAKKATEEVAIKENISLAYAHAQIGKYAGKNETFADEIKKDLENTYGTGSATVVANEGGTYSVTLNGKTYDIDANGNVTKQGASIVLGTETITDVDGTVITTKVEEGTEQNPVYVYIRFTATLTGSNDLSVTVTATNPTGLVASTPTLTDGVWVTRVSANGTYKFTITGTTEEGTSTITKDVKVSKFSNGLTIGSTVTYSPSGSYSWKAKYATSDKTVTKIENNQTVEDTSNDVNLSSASNGDFRITTWKVLSIDDETGEVQLIPSVPTTGTVRLQGPQGYNNAVKLLNDACDALYSKTENGIKIITARSINMEDFEGKVVNNVRVGGVLTDAAITARDSKNNGLSGDDLVNYGYTHTKAKSVYRDSSGNYTTYKNYPVIYGSEIDSIINGSSTNGTLGLSSQDEFIERIDKNNNYTAIAEKVTNATSIRPKQTYYNLGTTFNNTYKAYFKNYGTNNANSFADLLSPSGSNTNYWVASRCVILGGDDCYFNVCRVYSGYLDDRYLYNSSNGSNGDSHPLFPVVSLSSELISGNKTYGFNVE